MLKCQNLRIPQTRDHLSIKGLKVNSISAYITYQYNKADSLLTLWVPWANYISLEKQCDVILLQPASTWHHRALYTNGLTYDITA